MKRQAQRPPVDIRRQFGDYFEVFVESWNAWESDGANVPLPDSCERSVERFLCEGLSAELLTQAVEVAMLAAYVPTAHKFAYFCGVCWTHIRADRATRQQAAE